MAFDKSLDKELYGEEIAFETSKIRVSVMCYNEGQQKLQISRENLNPNTGEYGFAKLGRVLKEEAEKIIPAMQKALENMN